MLTAERVRPHGPIPRPAHVRVLARSVEEDRGYETPCLIFQGASNGPYGKVGIRVHGSTPAEDHYVYELVHRVVYAAEVGPIPEGFDVDHLCLVQRCVRSTHLEAVPPQENRRRQSERNGWITRC